MHKYYEFLQVTNHCFFFKLIIHLRRKETFKLLLRTIFQY